MNCPRILYEYSNDPFPHQWGIRNMVGIWDEIQAETKKQTEYRRGGPAYQAGVCYEVLDFKGVELRFSSGF